MQYGHLRTQFWVRPLTSGPLEPERGAEVPSVIKSAQTCQWKADLFFTNLGSLKMDPESRLTHALSSIVSGLVAATMGTPADVVKTRVMNQPFDAQGRGNELKLKI